MSDVIVLNKKIHNFNKKISISGDKSLSIRWVLFSSIASGTSRAYNLLMSEDVLAAIDAVKKLGIKVDISKDYCEIHGKGINGYEIKDNLTIDARNSGTLGRLILGLLVNSTKTIKIIGDKSLSKRDFGRVAEPLKKFGVKCKLNRNKGLPLTITGSNLLKPINYLENRGSAQCKICFANKPVTGSSRRPSANLSKKRSSDAYGFTPLAPPLKRRNKSTGAFLLYFFVGDLCTLFTLHILIFFSFPKLIFQLSVVL